MHHEPTTSICLTLQAELAACAIGAAVPSAALLAHLASCAHCQADFAAYQLVQDVPGAEPRALVRERLLAQAADTADTHHPTNRC